MSGFPMLCLVLIAGAAPLSAQGDAVASALPTRIRLSPISRTSNPVIGVPVSMAADTIRLVRHGTTDTVSVATASLGKVEEFRGRRSNLGRGAMIGSIVLGIGGAITVPLIADAIGDGPATDKAEAMGIGLVGGAIAGGLLGAGIGALTSRERWTARPIVRAHGASARGRLGFGLAMAVRF